MPAMGILSMHVVGCLRFCRATPIPWPAANDLDYRQVSTRR